MQTYYDPALVALSIAMAVFASFTALGLVAHIPQVPTERARRWLSGGAVAMGSGIWTMHFIGMLSFHLPVPLAYDPSITAASALIAIGGSALALGLVRHGIHGTWQLHGSALLMASAIASMHYTGMAAMRMAPPIEYNAQLVALSIFIAYLASLAALRIALRGSQTPLLFGPRNLYGALFLGLAISGMHYTGMAAAGFPDNSVCLAAAAGLGGAPLAVAIAAITLLILFTTLVVLRYDFRLTEQQAQMLDLLRSQNDALQQHAGQLAEEITVQVRESGRRDRLLATVVEQSDEAIVAVDLRGAVTIWNPGAERMYGYPAETAIGSPFAQFFAAAGQSVLPIDDHRRIEVRIAHSDGCELDVAFTRTPLLDESGKTIGEMFIGRDITAQKQALAEIRNLNESLEARVRQRTTELENAVRELEAFSYSVSHDLRAPLRALDGFSHLLLEEYAHSLQGQGSHYLARIRAASQRMGETIDALIELARLGRREMERQRVDMSALAQTIRHEIEHADGQRKTTWRIEQDVACMADPHAMRSILENLIRNAWKYSARREHAEIDFGRGEKGGERVYFVRDNGVGFDMAHADKLFGIFQRLHHPSDFEGSGIGLATVQRLVARHGGRVWAESMPEEGATFYFTLGA
ncbi:MAG: PAS domain S-box protein [Rhodocyclaceae bacterium]|nr:PAS domain S-box protein [Rhodocyclaceae bacterium]